MEKFIDLRTGGVAFFSKSTADAGLPPHYVRPGKMQVFPTKKTWKKTEEPKGQSEIKIEVKKEEPPAQVYKVDESINEQIVESDYSKEPTIDEMKEWLRAKGIRFSPNIGDEKLKERYYENQK